MKKIAEQKQKSISFFRKNSNNIRLVVGLIFCGISVLLAVSFFSYLMNWESDQSQASIWDKSVESSNLFGKFGDWLGNFFIFENIGISAFAVAFLFMVWGSLLLKIKYFNFWKTLGHSLFFICWLPVFLGGFTRNGNSVMSGVYGHEICEYLVSFIGIFGLWVVIITSFTIYYALEFKGKINLYQEKITDIKDELSSILPKKQLEEEENSQNDSKNIIVKENFDNKGVNKNIASDNEPQKEPTKSKVETPVEIEIEVNNTFPKPPKKTEKELDNAIDFEVIEPEKSENISPTIIDEIDKKSNDLVEEFGLYDHKLDLGSYQMPTIDLLKDYGNSEEISINREELEENKSKIVTVLNNFNVGIANIKATIGPTVTLYEIVPETGVRISQIKRLQDDIALSLSALGIRIIAPMPGKGTVGIEVPRKKTSMVSIRSVIGSKKFEESDMDLPIVFGRTISNEIFMADLTKMPHLLMAGATGQGKSVGINAILTSLLYKKHPSELKFVMVDPKKVELSLYSKIERHYLAKLPDSEDAIITDNNKVINTLNSLCIEMDARYELLKNAYCKNIKEYNKKFAERKLNPENGHRYLPYIVLVVDEFADLIMTAGKEVEHPIARLAQLARAVGIHLIVATQRPSVNVITGMIKANFPARAAFRVMTGVDSKTILDTSGAEQLVGKGDMLYLNGNEILRLQCAFVDTPEVERIADFIGEQRGYSSAYLLPEYDSGESGAATSFDASDRDAMFEEAARIVVTSQQGSTSMLQRQLKLGYNRAGRIMDQLEAAGIVGAFNGAKAREVLISDLNYLEQYLSDLKKG